MKFVSFALFLVTAEAYNTPEPPTGGRRAFLATASGTAAAFVVGAGAANANTACVPNNGFWDVATSPISCEGQAKELTPIEEAYAESLMSKLGVNKKDVLDKKKINKNKIRFEELDD